MDCALPSEDVSSWLSSPGAFIVDGIVEVLKRTRRWRSDGRSLRQLNKHWCLAINSHVVSIHPPNDRVIAIEDVQSLLKFPNLRALNITPFCYRHLCEVRSERCSYVMGILHQLSQLTDLKMDGRILDATEKDDISGIRCKAMTLNGFIRSSVVLFKLSDLPLQEMKLPSFCPGFLGRFLEATPTLKRLCVGVKYVTANDLLQLVALDELELDYFGEHASLAPMTSIVSLYLKHPVDHLEPFRWLRKLRRLEIYIRNSDVFDVVFWIVMRQLTRLMLQSIKWYIAPPPKFWEVATGLKELDIRHFLIESNFFLQHDFSNLRKLTLDSCRIDGETLPCEGLTSLTALHMISNVSRHKDLIQGFLDPRPIKGLKELHILFRNRDQTEELLLRISQLKHLESLELWNLMAVSPFNELPYAGLESLGALPNLSKLVIQSTADPEIVQWFRNLQFLTAIDDVELDIRPDDVAFD